MLTAGLIYFSLLFTSLFCAYKYKSYDYNYNLKRYEVNEPTFVVILITVFIILISSFRDSVGVDYESYFNLYNNYKGTDLNFWLFNEYGFHLFIISGIYLGYSAVWMFFFSSLISWGVLLKKISPSLLLFVILFLILDEKLFWSFNGVRQWIAVCFFTLTIKYLSEDKYKFFILFTFLGSLFHTSILYLLPIVLLFNKISQLNIYKYRNIIIIIYLFTMFIGTKESILSYINNSTISLGQTFDALKYYSRHAELGRILNQSSEVGFGFWIKRVLDLLLIIQVFKLKDRTITLSVLLFLFGTVFFNLFYSVQVLLRISIYFLIFRSFLWGYVFYKFKNKNFINNLVLFLYMILFVIAFVKGSNACCPYKFIF